mgnify:CR=1 FL=1
MMKAAKMYAGEIVSDKAAKLSKGEILRQAGYSNVTARQPSAVFDKPDFQALLDKYIPLDALTSRHAEILQTADEKIALNALELGYKVHGKMSAQGGSTTFAAFLANVSGNLVIPGSGEQLKEINGGEAQT